MAYRVGILSTSNTRDGLTRALRIDLLDALSFATRHFNDIMTEVAPYHYNSISVSVRKSHKQSNLVSHRQFFLHV